MDALLIIGCKNAVVVVGFGSVEGSAGKESQLEFRDGI